MTRRMFEIGVEGDRFHEHYEDDQCIRAGCVPVPEQPRSVRLDERLNKLVDPAMYDKDAFYHAQVTCFRQWLVAAEMAMEDEDVDQITIDRVLNRMVYATPDGASAYERQERFNEAIKRIERGKL
jgi:hypothetical protein